MAYYTDYTNVVAYSTSIARTNSAVSNAVIDYLVSYGGFSLVSHADTGVDSSASNYAEASWHGLYVRVYGAATLGTVTAYLAYTSNGTSLMSLALAFAFVASTSVTVKMRFFNTVSGMFVSYWNGSAWIRCAAGVVCTRISTGDTAYALRLGYLSAGYAIYINDGLSTTYYTPNTSYRGFADVDGTRQVIQNVQLSNSSTASYDARYICSDIYNSYQWLFTGIVQIGSRYFYISGTDHCAFELNA